jgi:hypothetical protein
LMLRGDARADRAEVLTLLDRSREAAEASEQAAILYKNKGIRAGAAATFAPEQR